MSELVITEFNNRVMALEREMRWWKRGSLILLLILIVGFLMGLSIQEGKVVEAQRILLKDSDGRIRVLLGDWNLVETPLPAPESFRYKELTSPLTTTESDHWGVHIFATDGTYLAGLKSRGLTHFANGVTSDNGWLILRDMKTESRIDMAVGDRYADFGMKASRLTHEQDAKEGEAFRKQWNSAKSVEERRVASLLRTPAEREARIFATKDQAQFGLGEHGISRLVLGQSVLTDQLGIESRHPLSSIIMFDKEGKVLRTFP